MKKLFITAGLAVACILAFAQGAKTQDAPKEHSMTGCLRAGTAPNTYMLSDLEKGPKSVGIVSSSANLAPHVRTQNRDHWNGRSSKGCRGRRKRSQGSALHESDLHQDGLANLPLILF